MKITLADSSPLLNPEFVFGVATASFQIEGAADSREPCIWDTFCAQPGRIKDGSDGLTACDHVARWREDVELIAALGVDAYRFSVAWGRVIRADGSINQAGLDFYIQLLDALKARNIKAFVTLYHWDLPQYLQDEGGWLNRATAYKFAEYADIVSRAFGDRVHSYATLNEPFCSAYLSYEAGIHAPGVQNRQHGRQGHQQRAQVRAPTAFQVRQRPRGPAHQWPPKNRSQAPARQWRVRQAPGASACLHCCQSA